MTTPAVKRIFSAIAKKGGEIRFVGGVVRDALLGRLIEDIDLAANLPPEHVIRALEAVGIKTIPTGVAHGTVTAVMDHKGYEITTLRHDVETYGRHAKVVFTDDWEADAARRDFTMNALYADASGKIYDYFGGYEDLLQYCVRFIGKAEDRIREDVLRILRFFRFYAWFGRGDADPEGLRACKELAHLLPQLSVERVWKELSKLLLADNPLTAIRLMSENDVLKQTLPEAKNLQRLLKLLQIEQLHKIAPHSLRRLAALLSEDAASTVGQRLRLSNHEKEYLCALQDLSEKLRDDLTPKTLRQMLYAFDAEKVQDGLLLLTSSGAEADVTVLLKAVKDWNAPVFPLQGGDVMALGIKEGPFVGEVLHAVEDWWINHDFRATKEDCIIEAKRLISNY